MVDWTAVLTTAINAAAASVAAYFAFKARSNANSARDSAERAESSLRPPAESAADAARKLWQSLPPPSA